MRKLSLPLALFGLYFTLPAAAQQTAEPNDPTAPDGAKSVPGSDTATDRVEMKTETPAAKPTVDPSSRPALPAQPSAPVEGSNSAPPVKSEVLSTGTIRGPATVARDDSWKFEYHGYIRAPMRIGMGHRDNPGAGQSSTTYHSPIIPDDQYLSWQSSPHNKTDWAELYISLGNSLAKGTVSIQGYQFADAAFSNPTTQLGIADGYVDLTPDLGYENLRLAWRVGAFSNKYGSAGKYDAGEYDTYMFGRIHNAGEVLHIDYDIDENNSLYVEHGFGFRKPDPSQYNNTRFTLLNHVHVGYKHTEALQFSAHFLDSFTHEEERSADPGIPVVDGLSSDPFSVPRNAATSITNIPDGRMWVAGLDARLDLGAYGYFYAAYSHVGLSNAVTIARAIEVIHASGGGEFGLGVTDNYLGPSCVDTQFHGDPTVHGRSYYPISAGGANGFEPTRACSLGNGHVDTLLGQYEFGLTNFLQQSSGGQKFWGEGQDAKLVLYGMYNKVTSDYRPTATDAAPTDGIHKLKYGADLSAAILPWLTAAVRFDRLQPNSRVPEQSFSILSPRVVFKSKWVTREAITLQYSRYIYNQRTCATGTPADGVAFTPGEQFCVQPPSSPVPPDGFGSGYPALTNVQQRGAPTTRPDLNVFKLEATMWW